jgi:hypothetical protein
MILGLIESHISLVHFMFHPGKIMTQTIVQSPYNGAASL